MNKLLEKNKPTRVLSVFTLVMINVIAIDSLRNLATNAEYGLSIVSMYLIAAVLFLLPCLLITAELATHHPKTGGVYVWVREAFGKRWGFVNIWLQWIYNVFWYPTILAFIAANVAYIFEPSLVHNKTYMLSMIVGLFILATVFNSFGMKVSGLVSSVCAIVGTIVPMVFILGMGVAWIVTGKPIAIDLSLHHVMPNLSSFHNMAFVVIVLFSLVGFEMSAVHAGEVKNPQRDYPKALFYSALIVLISALLSTCAIAVVVPLHDLNIVSGIDQAFVIFLQAFHLKWLLPVIVSLMILGGFGGMAAWVIGPSKGLMVAAEDGCTPKSLAKHSKRGVPLRVLLLQAVLVILICGLFFLFPNVSTSYWILSDLTAQLALIFYIILFAAAIKLRYTTPKNPDAYTIPGGKFGIWLVGLVGIFACLAAIIIGFVPPDNIPIGNIWLYESILVGGILIFCSIPFIIYKINHEKDRKYGNDDLQSRKKD